MAFAANEKLALHARSLSDQIVEQREVVKTAVTEAQELKGQNTRFLGDLERAHTAAVMAERRLWDSVNTIRDGFAVFDANQRLVTANRAYAAAFDGFPIEPGISYGELLHALASRGLVVTDGQDTDAWVARMVAAAGR